jgi:hypothetical protein
MKAAAILAFFTLIICRVSLGSDPAELETLRNSYQTAVIRTTKPLSETYLNELKKLRDQFTRGGKLEEANAVQAEITVISEKLNVMSTAATSGQVLAGDVKVLETTAVIPAASPEGFKLPPLRRGDKITLSYVSGLWKCDGNIASVNPDEEVTERGDRARLVLAEGPKNKVPGSIIKMVPPGTKDKPFSYLVQTTRDDVVLRIHSGSDNPKSPGAVTYTVKISR